MPANNLYTDIYDQANDRIAGWAKNRVPELRRTMASLGIQHRSYSQSPSPSASKLKTSLRKTSGLINRIGFSMPRQLIYTHKGVGRGTTIDQVGNTKRRAKPWYNPVIDQHIDELADIAAEEIGSAIINNILIR